jgi:predicted small lipoprotein YifL
MSSPPSATRFALLGSILATVAALTLTACGDDGPAAPEDAIAARQQQARAPAAPSQPCPAKLDVFVEDLNRLRRQLAVGLSYEQYAAKIEALRVSYDRIPVDHLTVACLTATGTPSEQAFNKYIDAANAWGECLADASCATTAIEPILQRKWRVASGFLSEARS